MRHLDIGYVEGRNMPRLYRRWFIDRYVKELSDKKEAIDTANNKRK
jgi:hypothetical protein